jgi:hypothetical protein
MISFLLLNIADECWRDHSWSCEDADQFTQLHDPNTLLENFMEMTALLHFDFDLDISLAVISSLQSLLRS